MKGLRDLNTISNQGLLITNDQRPTTITYTPNTPVNVSATAYSGKTFVPPVGTNLTTLINGDSQFVNLQPSGYGVLTQGLEYVIDLTGIPGASVNWANIQTNAAGLAKVPSSIGTGNLWLAHNGTYDSVHGYYLNTWTVAGIKSVGDWEWARDNAVVTLPANVTSITYPSVLSTYTNNRSWNTSLSILSLNQLSATNDFYYAANVSQLVGGVPQIFDLSIASFNANTYTLNLTYSAGTVANLYTTSNLGGTSTWSNANSRMTITGTITAINDRLNHLYYTPTAGLEDSFLFNYSLYNPVADFYSNISQPVRSNASLYVTRTSPGYYNYDAATYLVYPIQIIDTTTAGTPTYTMTISGTSGSVGSISTAGSGGTSSFNNSNKTLTISGTKTQVNSHLANVTLYPTANLVSSFNLNYGLTISSGVAVNKTQTMYVTNINSGYANVAVSRSFISNTGDQLIFANTTPVITENLGPTAQYTVYLTSTAGQFGLSLDTIASNFSYTDSVSGLNQKLSQIKFYPYKDVVGTQLFNMLIQRNGVNLVSQDIALLGTARTTPIPGAGTYIFTQNGTITTTWEQTQYLNTRILVVGGGGTGYGTPGYGTACGGGGGAQVLDITTPLRVGTLIITVGQGGDYASGYRGYSSYLSKVTPGGYTYAGYPFYDIIAYGGMNPGDHTSGANFINNSNYIGRTTHTGGRGQGGAGLGSNSPPYYAGGGGASQLNNGGDAQYSGSSSRGGKGADGVASNITGNIVYYGGGGGGWGTAGFGSGGLGGGGYAAGGGTPNTGGGGAGYYGAAGGSGIVVIKFY